MSSRHNTLGYWATVNFQSFLNRHFHGLYCGAFFLRWIQRDISPSLQVHLYAHFITCSTTVTADKLAKISRGHIFKNYGLSFSIVFKRSPYFWNSFCKFLNIDNRIFFATCRILIQLYQRFHELLTIVLCQLWISPLNQCLASSVF